MCARIAISRTAIFAPWGRSEFFRIVPSRVSRNSMCRARRGSSPFVLDRTKRQAPGWCESYKRRVGPKRARWWVVGKPGRRPVYRSNRNRQSDRVLSLKNDAGRALALIKSAEGREASRAAIKSWTRITRHPHPYNLSGGCFSATLTRGFGILNFSLRCSRGVHQCTRFPDYVQLAIQLLRGGGIGIRARLFHVLSGCRHCHSPMISQVILQI
jgi:hypothetical protein